MISFQFLVRYLQCGFDGQPAAICVGKIREPHRHPQNLSKQFFFFRNKFLFLNVVLLLQLQVNGIIMPVPTIFLEPGRLSTARVHRLIFLPRQIMVCSMIQEVQCRLLGAVITGTGWTDRMSVRTFQLPVAGSSRLPRSTRSLLLIMAHALEVSTRTSTEYMDKCLQWMMKPFSWRVLPTMAKYKVRTIQDHRVEIKLHRRVSDWPSRPSVRCFVPGWWRH